MSSTTMSSNENSCSPEAAVVVVDGSPASPARDSPNNEDVEAYSDDAAPIPRLSSLRDAREAARRSQSKEPGACRQQRISEIDRMLTRLRNTKAEAYSGGTAGAGKETRTIDDEHGKSMRTNNTGGAARKGPLGPPGDSPIEEDVVDERSSSSSSPVEGIAGARPAGVSKSSTGEVYYSPMEEPPPSAIEKQALNKLNVAAGAVPFKEEDSSAGLREETAATRGDGGSAIRSPTQQHALKPFEFHNYPRQVATNGHSDEMSRVVVRKYHGGNQHTTSASSNNAGGSARPSSSSKSTARRGGGSTSSASTSRPPFDTRRGGSHSQGCTSYNFQPKILASARRSRSGRAGGSGVPSKSNRSSSYLQETMSARLQQTYGAPSRPIHWTPPSKNKAEASTSKGVGVDAHDNGHGPGSQLHQVIDNTRADAAAEGTASKKNHSAGPGGVSSPFAFYNDHYVDHEGSASDARLADTFEHHRGEALPGPLLVAASSRSNSCNNRRPSLSVTSGGPRKNFSADTRSSSARRRQVGHQQGGIIDYSSKNSMRPFLSARRSVPHSRRARTTQSIASELDFRDKSPLRSAREYLQNLTANSSPEKIPPNFQQQLRQMRATSSSKGSSSKNSSHVESANGSRVPSKNNDISDSKNRSKSSSAASSPPASSPGESQKAPDHDAEDNVAGFADDRVNSKSSSAASVATFSAKPRRQGASQIADANVVMGLEEAHEQTQIAADQQQYPQQGTMTSATKNTDATEQAVGRVEDEHDATKNAKPEHDDASYNEERPSPYARSFFSESFESEREKLHIDSIIALTSPDSCFAATPPHPLGSPPPSMPAAAGREDVGDKDATGDEPKAHTASAGESSPARASLVSSPINTTRKTKGTRTTVASARTTTANSRTNMAPKIIGVDTDSDEKTLDEVANSFPFPFLTGGRGSEKNKAHDTSAKAPWKRTPSAPSSSSSSSCAKDVGDIKTKSSGQMSRSTSHTVGGSKMLKSQLRRIPNPINMRLPSPPPLPSPGHLLDTMDTKVMTNARIKIITPGSCGADDLLLPGGSNLLAKKLAAQNKFCDYEPSLEELERKYSRKRTTPKTSPLGAPTGNMTGLSQLASSKKSVLVHQQSSPPLQSARTRKARSRSASPTTVVAPSSSSANSRGNSRGQSRDGTAARSKSREKDLHQPPSTTSGTKNYKGAELQLSSKQSSKNSARSRSNERKNTSGSRKNIMKNSRASARGPPTNYNSNPTSATTQPPPPATPPAQQSQSLVFVSFAEPPASGGTEEKAHATSKMSAAPPMASPFSFSADPPADDDERLSLVSAGGTSSFFEPPARISSERTNTRAQLEVPPIWRREGAAAATASSRTSSAVTQEHNVGNLSASRGLETRQSSRASTPGENDSANSNVVPLAARISGASASSSSRVEERQSKGSRLLDKKRGENFATAPLTARGGATSSTTTNRTHLAQDPSSTSRSPTSTPLQEVLFPNRGSSAQAGGSASSTAPLPSARVSTSPPKSPINITTTQISSDKGVHRDVAAGEEMTRVTAKLQELTTNLDSVLREEIALREKVDNIAKAQQDLAQSRQSRLSGTNASTVEPSQEMRIDDVISKLERMERTNVEMVTRIERNEGEMSHLRNSFQGNVETLMGSSEDDGGEVPRSISIATDLNRVEQGSAATSLDTSFSAAMLKGHGGASSSSRVVGTVSGFSQQATAPVTRLADLIEGVTATKLSLVESNLDARLRTMEENLAAQLKSKECEVSELKIAVEKLAATTQALKDDHETVIAATANTAKKSLLPSPGEDSDGALCLSSILGPKSSGSARSSLDGSTAGGENDFIERQSRAARRRELLAQSLAPVLLSQNRETLKAQVEEHLATVLAATKKPSPNRSKPASPNQTASLLAEVESRQAESLDRSREQVERALAGLRERLDTVETTSTSRVRSAEEEATSLRTQLQILASRVEGIMSSGRGSLVAARTEEELERLLMHDPKTQKRIQAVIERQLVVDASSSSGRRNPAEGTPGVEQESATENDASSPSAISLRIPPPADKKSPKEARSRSPPSSPLLSRAVREAAQQAVRDELTSIERLAGSKRKLEEEQQRLNTLETEGRKIKLQQEKSSPLSRDDAAALVSAEVGRRMQAMRENILDQLRPALQGLDEAEARGLQQMQGNGKNKGGAGGKSTFSPPSRAAATSSVAKPVVVKSPSYNNMSPRSRLRADLSPIARLAQELDLPELLTLEGGHQDQPDHAAEKELVRHDETSNSHLRSKILRALLQPGDSSACASSSASSGDDRDEIARRINRSVDLFHDDIAELPLRRFSPNRKDEDGRFVQQQNNYHGLLDDLEQESLRLDEQGLKPPERRQKTPIDIDVSSVVFPRSDEAEVDKNPFSSPRSPISTLLNAEQRASEARRADRERKKADEIAARRQSPTSPYRLRNDPTASLDDVLQDLHLLNTSSSTAVPENRRKAPAAGTSGRASAGGGGQPSLVGKVGTGGQQQASASTSSSSRFFSTVNALKSSKNAMSTSSSAILDSLLASTPVASTPLQPAARSPQERRRSLKHTVSSTSETSDDDLFRGAVQQTSAEATDLRRELDALKAQLVAWQVAPPTLASLRKIEKVGGDGGGRNAGGAGSARAREDIANAEDDEDEKIDLVSTTGGINANDNASSSAAEGADDKNNGAASPSSLNSDTAALKSFLDKHKAKRQNVKKKMNAGADSTKKKEKDVAVTPQEAPARRKSRLQKALKLLESEEIHEPKRLFRSSGW